MTEWLVERGIGETRAALLHDGEVLAMRIERASDGVRAGDVVAGRLRDSHARIVELAGGEPAWLRQPEAGLEEGRERLFLVERSAIPERDLTKRAIVRLAAQEASAPCPAPTLHAALCASDVAVREIRPDAPQDELANSGWFDHLAEAENGVLPFAGGVLRLALTPAMAVLDVDGDCAPCKLALAGAAAAAQTIARLDLAGSVAIDLPTGPARIARQQAADAFDAAWPPHLPAPAKAAVNSFGLLHLVRRRTGPSIAERLHFARIESAALLLLRQAQRARGAGQLTLHAHPLVTQWLSAHPDLLALLGRSAGRSIALQADAKHDISGGHAQ